MTIIQRSAWDTAIFVIRQLRAAGHVALLAGGCVRDRLLNHPPKDYDVATDARPDQVQGLFPKARHVGAKFGVILVRKFGHDIEVATFRSDGAYSDGRHPDAVAFGTDREDAERRDFTINGLFFDPIDERVIDFVDGQRDIQDRIIRTIGDSDRRFAEDHLRMLRAVRFAARLDFAIHPQTHAAIVRNAARLATISAERIWLELEMILTHPTRVRGWRLLREVGLRPHLSPGWTSRGEEDLRTERRLAALPSEPVDATLALACLLCERPLSDAERIGRALKLSNRLVECVSWLTDRLPRTREPGRLELADLKELMAHPEWTNLQELLRADLAAREERPDAHHVLCRRAADIDPDRVSPPPLLTGDELMQMGLPPGPRMGIILKHLYREQLNERLSSKEDAAALARALIAESQEGR